MFFARLDLQAARKLLEPLRAAIIDHGTPIYCQGEPGLALFSIRRGLVKLSLLSADGVEHTLRLLGKGALIGLESSFREPYHHSATAVSEVALCRIPADSLVKLTDSQPRLYDDLMANWQSQLDLADANLIAHSRGSARERILHYLTDLNTLCEHSGIPLWLPTNQDCASLVSSTVESVSRVMADLKRRGVLTHHSDGSWEFNAGESPTL